MCHYHHSLSIDATIMVSRNCPITGEHVGIISAWWNFFLLRNFDKQNEMQLLAKFEQILYMGFRAALNFRKFKVALDSMHRIALNVSLNLPIYYSFRHVLKPGTPEHRNTITLRNTPTTGTAKKAQNTEFDGVVLFSQYRSCKQNLM